MRISLFTDMKIIQALCHLNFLFSSCSWSLLLIINKFLPSNFYTLCGVPGLGSLFVNFSKLFLKSLPVCLDLENLKY